MVYLLPFNGGRVNMLYQYMLHWITKFQTLMGSIIFYRARVWFYHVLPAPVSCSPVCSRRRQASNFVVYMYNALYDYAVEWTVHTLVINSSSAHSHNYQCTYTRYQCTKHRLPYAYPMYITNDVRLQVVQVYDAFIQ